MGGTCSYISVQSGDSCGSLASRCQITPSQFTEYNPGSGLCSTLQVNQPVCCTAGALPNLAPQPNSDGTCATYIVQSGDWCAAIASSHYPMTVSQLESYNSQTWGWKGCGALQPGQVLCLSTGTPPMPAALDGAKCGPQVSGTPRPSNWEDIASLNPCPLNACCSAYGYCGTTAEFCATTQSPTGAPGSSGCVSNCETGIKNNDNPPAAYLKVGYYEGFNGDRPCLNMRPDQIPDDYTHMHFAFASVSKDFDVDLGKYQTQFEQFAQRTSWKRVLSFGGWSFKTNADSVPIFLDSVTDAQRSTFAKNVVKFVNMYNLDGVDFDWEYPGATDIPDAPKGGPNDGSNYLKFLRLVRQALPQGKTVSMAAPASYWYLQNYPIADMAQVLDYIVYMTYDLHGQWDWNSPGSQSGCPTGDCLRSHVNLTEQVTAASMITKAGVPASKIIIGLASYARSFRMVTPSCRGPTCKYKGPASSAGVGKCTNTAGFISQAELEKMVRDDSLGSVVQHYFDDDSNSDIVMYGSTWAAYLSEDTKSFRRSAWQFLNFGGTVDWAVDLAAFVDGGKRSVAPGLRRGQRMAEV